MHWNRLEGICRDERNWRYMKGTGKREVVERKRI